jgi:hypothetical protein
MAGYKKSPLAKGNFPPKRIRFAEGGCPEVVATKNTTPDPFIKGELIQRNVLLGGDQLDHAGFFSVPFLPSNPARNEWLV